MDKQKLLIIPSWYPGQRHNAGIFIENQVTVLAQHYDVMVYVPQIYSLRKLLVEWFLTTMHPAQGTAFPVIQRHILYTPKLPLTLFCAYYLAVVRHDVKHILATWGRPALIHTHFTWPAGWAAMKAGTAHAIPIVLTEHAGYFGNLLQSPFQKRLVYETLGRVHHIIAVSPALKEQIQRFYSHKTIDVVGNIIETDFFVPLAEHEDRESIQTTQKQPLRFLCVATLNKGKGIHVLLEAAHMLMQRGRTAFELLIGGDGPERSRLEAMARAYGLSERCHFLGMLTKHEVKYHMQRCDVFVLPSLHETFGVVLTEAMACGKPVIATRCGGPEFVVAPDTGILIDAADPAALAGAMDGFLSQTYTFDASRIRQSVHERFGEEAFMRHMSAIYTEVCTR